jgi:rhodanese-related sulfurtransferase|tara:strand:+ start:103 stop:528 length:426 start_codon:yes stop_codon:yes gene_type:complete
MGNTSTYLKKVNFEDIQECIKNKQKYLLINTLKKTEQKCLIQNTTSIENEEKIINECLKKQKNVKIIIYDKNSNETTLFKKYEQLSNLGFPNVYIYPGGLFEWLCLQDIYGYEEFPTSTKEMDILKFKSQSAFNGILLIGN